MRRLRTMWRFVASTGTVFTSLLAMDKLALDIGFDIGIGPGSSTHSQAGSIVEHLNIRLGFEDIRLNATAVVAVLADQLSSVRLLRFIEDPLGCLVYPMYVLLDARGSLAEAHMCLNVNTICA